jgi:DNA polymerase-3 subunit alpha
MIAVFDLETTGLLTVSSNPEQQPGIVQIGVIRCDPVWKEVDRIDQLINPEVWFHPEAQEVTGIKEEDLVGQPTLRAFHTRMCQAFLGVSHLIGFNTDFDTQVLDWNLKRYNLDRKFPWPPRHTDLMKIAKDALNIQGKADQKFPKLEELHKALFGEGFSGAHKAINDVEATMRCAIEMEKQGLLFT